MENKKINKPLSAATWCELVAEFQGSGLTRREFCESKCLNIRTFGRWFKKFSTKQDEAGSEIKWVQLNEELPTTENNFDLEVKITYRNVSVEIQNGFDFNQLKTIIHVLKETC